MSEWTKLPGLPGRHNPCACCPPIEASLSLDATIAVGFGDASAYRDGECVYREPGPFDGMERCECNWQDDCGKCSGDGFYRGKNYVEPEVWEVARVEALAALDPDHDWRIHLHGPLHGEEYQRHGEGMWVLVAKDNGFA